MDHNHFIVRFKNQKLIFIQGVEAETFLNNLITTDVNVLALHTMRPGALLSPQGKVMFDFMIGRSQNGFIIDIKDDQAPAFIKRLSLYKLRAQVEIIESEESVVTVSCGNDSTTSQIDSTYDDLRFPPSLHVKRIYHTLLDETDSVDDIDHNDDWLKLRISFGILESGIDFALGDVFPHDIAYDQIGGVSFKKGCYIGQEVVSRMHHRGTAKRRPLIVNADENLPDAGNIIESAKKPIGTLGTTVKNQGLTLTRIDRAKMAMDNDQAITTDGIIVSLSIPENMTYGFPENSQENNKEDD